MNKTVAKFQITTKKEIPDASVKQPDGSFKPGKVVSLEALPVTSGSEENDSFFAATPAGHLGLSVVKFESLEGFEVGDFIYVTIEKVQADAEAEAAASPGTL